MDQLELLKQNWKQREENHPKLSYTQIYNMLFKRSTSIVKWIFIISVVELIFWIGIATLTPKSYWELYEKMNLVKAMWITNCIHYIIVLFFIVQFYKNFKNIKVTDSIKNLMSNIIKTRKTVKYFVIYNVVLWVISLFGISLYFYSKNDLLLQYFSEYYNEHQIDVNVYDPNFITGFFISFFIIGLIMVLFIIGFYRIIYGILLKRLMKNYKELEKIEI